jgi:hypothetical protein
MKKLINNFFVRVFLAFAIGFTFAFLAACSTVPSRTVVATLEQGSQIVTLFAEPAKCEPNLAAQATAIGLGPVLATAKRVEHSDKGVVTPGCWFIYEDRVVSFFDDGEIGQMSRLGFKWAKAA